MFNLDCTHPAFDTTMEVLCSLPVDNGRDDCGICLFDLAADMGEKGQVAVNERIKRLRDEGHAIRTWNRPGRRVASLAVADTLPQSLAVAEKYVDDVHNTERVNTGFSH